LNLQQNPTEPYYTCPHCLTQIKIDQKLKTDNTPEETPLQEAQPKILIEIEEKKVKPAACHYHLGYLSERSSKEQFPDDCLVCKDIVDCMQKKRVNNN
jgi:hypothetical protein